MNQETLALEAAELLVAVYREGKRRGGHIEWSDLDIAHEIARHALVVARCSARARLSATTLRPRRFPVPQAPWLSWVLENSLSLGEIDALLDRS